MTLISLTAVAGIHANSDVITVYECGRGWTVADKPVTKGQRLSAIAELSGTENDSDLVLDCAKEGLIAYSCTRQPCRVPVCSNHASGALVSQMDSNHILKAIASRPENGSDAYLKREPKPVAILGVRAGGSLSDSVIRITNSEVHWGPAFSRVLEGAYCMRLSSMPVESSMARKAALNWDRSVDAEGLLAMPGLSSGLYSVEKGSPDASGKCVLDPDLPAAWILVVSDADFEPLNQAWKDAVGQVTQLQADGASPLVVSTFRHVILARLADSMKDKSGGTAPTRK